jgi:hypothetical protein
MLVNVYNKVITLTLGWAAALDWEMAQLVLVPAGSRKGNNSIISSNSSAYSTLTVTICME